MATGGLNGGHSASTRQFVPRRPWLATQENYGTALACLVEVTAASGIGPIAQMRALQRPRAVEARQSTSVNPRRTPTAPSRIRAALAVAHRKLTGQAASPEKLDILTAHVNHETARGDRMFNYNFGGIKGTGPSGLTARYQTHEYTDGRKHSMKDGFRAYRNLEEGAVDYLKLMSARYGAALDRADVGDVAGFSSALKRNRYYTAPEAAYTKAMAAHVRQGVGDDQVYRGQVSAAGSYLYGNELRAESAEFGGRELAPPTSVEVARVMDAVGRMTARIGSPIDEAEKERQNA